MIQAATGHDLTVYGTGRQAWVFLNSKDSGRCVEVATEDLADKGEFQVFNQFIEEYFLYLT